MLDKLRKKLAEIEESNQWEHDFVEGLLIEMEEGRDFKKRPITNTQFKILTDINYKYNG